MDFNKQVKVIGHKAIGESIGNGGDVMPVFLEKIRIVFLFPEKIFAAIGMVVNMV